MANPLEQFEIVRHVPLSIAGLDVSITNSTVWMLVAVLTIWAFMIAGTRKLSVVPDRWQAAAESMHEFVGEMLDQNVGPEGRRYLPFLFSLFMFILVCNLLGMLPWLHPFTVTSHAAVTFGMAIFVFLIVIVIGFARHGLHFLSLFNPAGVPLPLKVLLVIPIELISFLSRPVTLGIRLFANMTAGHVLLKVFGTFVVSLGAAGGILSLGAVVPAFFNILFTALELLVAVLQAYVFALLTAVYLNDAVNLH